MLHWIQALPIVHSFARMMADVVVEGVDRHRLVHIDPSLILLEKQESPITSFLCKSMQDAQSVCE